MTQPPAPIAGPPPLPRHSPILIGTAGWSIPRASAEAFPGPGSHLDRYARILPCAEINATFYRSPRSTTYQRWTATVPEDFRFSVKAPKAITHEAALACSPLQLRTFLDEVSQLGTRLGPILFQLPPKLAFDPDLAATFFHHLRDLYSGPAVLEPRHLSWFSAEADLLLKQLQISRVAADPALTPSAASPGGSRDLLYFRLHGSPRTYYSSYSPAWIEDLAKTLAGQHTYETWCIFDNTASGAAAGNAIYLRQTLSHRNET